MSFAVLLNLRKHTATCISYNYDFWMANVFCWGTKWLGCESDKKKKKRKGREEKRHKERGQEGQHLTFCQKPICPWIRTFMEKRACGKISMLSGKHFLPFLFFPFCHFCTQSLCMPPKGFDWTMGSQSKVRQIFDWNMHCKHPVQINKSVQIRMNLLFKKVPNFYPKVVQLFLWNWSKRLSLQA